MSTSCRSASAISSSTRSSTGSLRSLGCSDREADRRRGDPVGSPLCFPARAWTMPEQVASLPSLADDMPAAARPGRGPWATALRKLRSDRGAVTALILFLVIVALCLVAPFYARYV